MIGFDKVSIGIGYDRQVFRWFCEAMLKHKERKTKEPKGNAEDGSYCPKKKFGQSWAYTKEKIAKEDTKEDII